MGTVILGGIICGVISISYYLHFSVHNFLAFGGKFVMNATFSLIYVVNAELYPTTIRSTGTSLVSFTSKLAGTVAPFAILLKPAWKFYTIYFVLSITFGLLTFTLPETKNKQIPTTIAQVIQEENEEK